MKALKFYTISIVFGFTFLIAFYAKAQEEIFKINAQYRLRPELRNGYRTVYADTSRTAFFIAQRARLAFEFKKEKLSAYTSIQDTRTWGDEEQLKDLAGLSFNELWVELGLKKGFSVKAGRQELVYDDQRLLGNLDWANSTRSHDALLVKFGNTNKKITWHTGGSFNQAGEPLSGTDYSLKNYKFLFFSWFKKQFKDHSLSATVIANGLNSTLPLGKKTHTSITFGPLYNFQNSTWKAVAGIYYQTGKTENNLSLDAWMINTYVEAHTKKFFAGAGIDYITGNSDKTRDSRSHNFSTLYATNHKFYGYMDYFINLPADTKQRGLIDPYGRLGFSPDKRITTTIDIHHFLLANEKNQQPYVIKKELGDEVDIIADYKVNPVINLTAGFSILFATRNMELIKGGNNINTNLWAFMMLKVSPTYFIHDQKKIN